VTNTQRQQQAPHRPTENEATTAPPPNPPTEDQKRANVFVRAFLWLRAKPRWMKRWFTRNHPDIRSFAYETAKLALVLGGGAALFFAIGLEGIMALITLAGYMLAILVAVFLIAKIIAPEKTVAGIRRDVDDAIREAEAEQAAKEAVGVS
jgi:hypothetical protein